jgi:YidC/Oxa1 family membrane protein insertase
LEFGSILLAFANPFQPIVVFLHLVLTELHGVLHNYGWSLVALAAIVKIVFWPLNTMQFKSMLKMQSLAPRVKTLQARYKNDREKLNAETMKLYKESGTNPAAGCLPLLLQMPILLSLYWAVISDQKMFATSTWLWITKPLCSAVPNNLLACNLSEPDYLLLALYVVSMYFSIRFTSPAMDPQQAQQQRVMAFLSPAMIGFFGYRYHWPSALLIYWLSFNVFTMAQQFFLINRYHRNPAPIGPHPELAADDASDGKPQTALASETGSSSNPGLGGTPNARSKRKRRSKR